MMRTTRIIIFAKAPLAGLAKTRLAPALGAEGAARLARQMLIHTAGNAIDAALGVVELCAAPSIADPAWPVHELPQGLQWSEQGEGDLGERMHRAAARALGNGLPVMLIGTDCPALGPGTLRNAAQALIDHDAVLIPSTDGGYVLLGLNRFEPALFSDMPWSTPAVATETLRRIGEAGWSVRILGAEHDIDEAADLEWLPEAWQKDMLPERIDACGVL